MKIRLAAYLQSDSIVDGEGIRTVIWTQGCPHHCLGCHNPETWDFDGGALVDVSEVCEIIDSLEGQDGITFSGGDPFMQAKACSEIAKYARSKGLNIWAYTGFNYEDLIHLSEKKPEILDFLNEIDAVYWCYHIKLSKKSVLNISKNKNIFNCIYNICSNSSYCCTLS